MPTGLDVAYGHFQATVEREVFATGAVWPQSLRYSLSSPVHQKICLLLLSIYQNAYHVGFALAMKLAGILFCSSFTLSVIVHY